MKGISLFSSAGIIKLEDNRYRYLTERELLGVGRFE